MKEEKRISSYSWTEPIPADIGREQDTLDTGSPEWFPLINSKYWICIYIFMYSKPIDCFTLSQDICNLTQIICYIKI